jgi:hypothetical protein
MISPLMIGHTVAFHDIAFHEQPGEPIGSRSFFPWQVTDGSPNFIFRETAIKPWLVQRGELKSIKV